MNVIKKIFAGLISTAMVASSAGVFAATSDVEGTKYQDAVQVLSALNIMNGDGDGNYRPNDTITRAEVARMIVSQLGLEDAAASSKGISKFPDVSVDFWANGYINIATSQGIVVGDDLGNYRPQDPITYAEAMTIYVRAAGYAKAAETKGGFPQGYIITGSDNGTAKGVSGSANQPISRGDVALLAKNALEVKLMEITGYGDSMKYEVTDKTMLYDKLDVTKGEGQIVATQDTAINGVSNLTADQVKIGDNVYTTEQSLTNLLGYNVEYYLKDTDAHNNTVILAQPKKDKNTSVSIDAKLFQAVSTKNSNKVLEYLKQETDTKNSTVTLDTNAKLIYNGKYETMTDELINLKDKSGNIVVLDTDKNGKYDILFVTEYTNMVVEAVSASDKITDKYSAAAIKFDKEDEDLRYTIRRGFEEIALSDLKEYDVLSIAASKDSKLYSIQVSNAMVEGKVTGVDAEGVYINGEYHEIANNFTQALPMGTEGKFYLDIDGRIAATDSAVAASENYAYLVKAYADMSTDEIAKFKVYTKNGEEKTFAATEKIKLNGQSGQLATDVVKQLNTNSVTNQQLITYGLNSEGQLISLNTAADNTATGAVDKNKFTKNYDLTNAVYNDTLKSLGKVKVDANTIVFDIPAASDNVADYSIANASMFEDKQSYNVIVFDTTDEYYAKVVIVTDAAYKTNADASIAVVSKIANVTNASDEVTDMLYAYQDGKEININAASQGVLVKNGTEALKNGDIIQYHTNNKGEIASIRVLFDVNNKTVEKSENPMENLDTIYGKVTKKFATSMNVTVNDGSSMNILLPDGITVYSVDTTKTKNNITVATKADIQVYDQDEGNRVFVRMYKDTVKDVVIIK